MARDKEPNSDLEERLAQAESMIRALQQQMETQIEREVPVHQVNPIPFFRIATDRFLKPSTDARGNLTLQLNTDEMKRDMVATAGGGGGGSTTGECEITFVNSVDLITSPSDPDCWVLFDVTFRYRLFVEDNVFQCELLNAFAQFKHDKLIRKCTDADSSYTPGGDYPDMDRWVGPCADSGSDGSTFVYIDRAVYDSLIKGGAVDPVIQLDGAGLCYQLDARGVTATPTAFDEFTLMSTCADSDCETPVPCDFTPANNFPGGLKIGGFTGAFFGQLQVDLGGGCVDCTDGSPFATEWDGVYQWSAGDSAYTVDNATFFFDGGTNNLGISGGHIKFVNPGGGDPCYFELRLVFTCSSSSALVWRKYFGDDELGSYVLDEAASTATIPGCSPGIPNTITVVAA